VKGCIPVSVLVWAHTEMQANAGQGRAGQGDAGRGGAGQGRAGQGRKHCMTQCKRTLRSSFVQSCEVSNG
jgi:hypothetical protein